MEAGGDGGEEMEAGRWRKVESGSATTMGVRAKSDGWRERIKCTIAWALQSLHGRACMGWHRLKHEVSWANGEWEARGVRLRPGLLGLAFCSLYCESRDGVIG